MVKYTVGDICRRIGGAPHDFQYQRALVHLFYFDRLLGPRQH